MSQSESFQDRLDWAAGRETEGDNPYRPNLLFIHNITQEEWDQAVRAHHNLRDNYKRQLHLVMGVQPEVTIETVELLPPRGTSMDLTYWEEFKPFTETEWENLKRVLGKMEDAADH